MRKLYDNLGREVIVYSHDFLDNNPLEGFNKTQSDEGDFLLIETPISSINIFRDESLVIQDGYIYSMITELVDSNFRSQQLPEFISQVSEFHKLFDHPILSEPTIPPIDRMKLRMTLLLEEVFETFMKVEDQGQIKPSVQNLVSTINFSDDIVNVADGLSDIMYVLAGAILEFGLQDRFLDLFNEVQRSNMSKSCSNIEEAEESARHYIEEVGVDVIVVNKEDKFILKRKDDDKLLKPLNYSKADLNQFLK